jgi:hypothetical protein
VQRPVDAAVRSPYPRPLLVARSRSEAMTCISRFARAVALRMPVLLSVRLRPGLIALYRLSEDGTHDEHPSARDEMLQVIRQALDVFARLLLKAIHLDDLRDQHVIGLTDRLSGYVRRSCKTPVRHCVQRPADDAPIPRHQTFKVLCEFRRAQLKQMRRVAGALIHGA